MSLRARLFLVFGGLVAVLVVGQWLLVRTLTADLSEQVGEVAVSVGRDVISEVVSTHKLREAPRADAGGAGGSGGRLPEADESLRRLPAGGGTRTGHRIAIVELEEPDGATWVQDVIKLDPPPGAAPGPRETAIFTYELKLDRPGEQRTLFLAGPDVERRIPIPSVGVRQAVDRASARMLLGSTVLLLLGLLAAGMVAHRVASPLRGLARAARTMGEGELGVQAPVGAGGEVGEAIAAFNSMSLRLRDLDAAARELRAREHLTELGEVARGLAHTLRNPLNALGLSLEELAEQAGGGAASGEIVAGARRQIRRIDQSIRSFLALASGDAPPVEAVDLDALLRDVVLEVLHDSRSGVRVEIQEPSAPVRLEGVVPELRAVLQALVVNAVEASPREGRVQIRLRGAGEGGRVRVEIEDAGPGLDQEVRRRLFTPHVTTKAHGSGMGLFLAHRIATTRYGGSLDLLAAAPQGVRAVLELADRQGANGA